MSGFLVWIKTTENEIDYEGTQDKASNSPLSDFWSTKGTQSTQTQNEIVWLFHLVSDMISSQLAKQHSFSLHSIAVHSLLSYLY